MRFGGRYNEVSPWLTSKMFIINLHEKFLTEPNYDDSWAIMKFPGSEDLDILHLISVNIRGLIVICVRMMEITRCKY